MGQGGLSGMGWSGVLPHIPYASTFLLNLSQFLFGRWLDCCCYSFRLLERERKTVVWTISLLLPKYKVSRQYTIGSYNYIHIMNHLCYKQGAVAAGTMYVRDSRQHDTAQRYVLYTQTRLYRSQ